MRLYIHEDLDDSAKDIAEQVLETFLSDINRLKGIYLSYKKLYNENKDNADKLLEISDKLAQIIIQIPDDMDK